MKINLIKKTMLVFAFILSIKTCCFGEIPEEYQIKDPLINFGVAELNMDRIEKALSDFVNFTDIILTEVS